jgi:hypothetical protein
MFKTFLKVVAVFAVVVLSAVAPLPAALICLAYVVKSINE